MHAGMVFNTEVIVHRDLVYNSLYFGLFTGARQ